MSVIDGKKKVMYVCSKMLNQGGHWNQDAGSIEIFWFSGERGTLNG